MTLESPIKQEGAFSGAWTLTHAPALDGAGSIIVFSSKQGALFVKFTPPDTILDILSELMEDL